MKNYQLIKIFFLSVVLGICTQSILAQAPPQGFNYQAVARDNAGAPITNHPIGLRLSITDGSGLTVYYQETQTPTTNQFGLFSVSVGSGTLSGGSGALSAVSWATISPWLHVEMDPNGGTSYADMGKSALLSVPYAMFAAGGVSGATWFVQAGAPSNSTGAINDLYLNTSNGNYYKKTGATTWALQGNLTGPQGTAGGNGTAGTNGTNGATWFTGSGAPSGATGTIGDFYLNTATGDIYKKTGASAWTQQGTLTSASSLSGTANYVVKFATSTTVGNSLIYDNGTNVGIGTITPAYPLSVNGANATTLGLFSNLTASGDGIAGQNTAAVGAGGGIGVYGATQQSGGAGVLGVNFNTTGAGVIGVGDNFAFAGPTVGGSPGTGGGLFYGVNLGAYGEVDVDGAFGGVVGLNANYTTTDGSVYNSGVQGAGFTGVVGVATSGIPDPNTNGDLGDGVLSVGDMECINGDIIADNGDIYSFQDISIYGTKAFQIDHPLDPDNKFLKHFCIESNEVLDMYRGGVHLDINGEAIVQLPNYFEALNTNFSYQLTSIGQPGPSLYVKSKIANNTFVIAGGQPNQEVSWQVTGERNDPYLSLHPERRAIEIAKNSSQIGKYAHPADYGKSDKLSLASYNKRVAANKIQSNLSSKRLTNAKLSKTSAVNSASKSSLNMITSPAK